MKSLRFGGCALNVSIAAALLTGCGGSSMPIRATDNSTTDASALKNSKTFDYTGNEQTFIVPTGVRQLTVIARGGEGGGFVCSCADQYPGLAGRVYAVIRVHRGDKLYVFVGGSDSHGGFNGGGAGGPGYGSCCLGGYGGGGASDVRIGGEKLKDRIILAAGGGGAGGNVLYSYNQGGDGGGLVGGAGRGDGYSNSGSGGTGGTQSAGGTGGAGGLGRGRKDDGQPGDDGALGRGGDGGSGAPAGGSSTYDRAAGGGGAGGGYHGGGGGGGGGIGGHKHYDTNDGGGGGGGSSYVEPSAIKSHMWTGWKKAKGDGRVIFRWN